MLSLLFSLLGAALGVLIMGQEVGMTGTLGLISLMGQAVGCVCQQFRETKIRDDRSISFQDLGRNLNDRFGG